MKKSETLLRVSGKSSDVHSAPFQCDSTMDHQLDLEILTVDTNMASALPRLLVAVQRIDSL